MKKTLLLLAVLVLTFAIFGVGIAYAQGSTPPRPYGPLHDFIERALATRLNLSEAQIEQEFAAGKTMAQIALDHGIAATDLPTFLTEVHQQALSEAVKAGVITQAQADWMLQHMARMGYGYGYGYGYGPGNCPMGYGAGAAGFQNGGYGYGRGPMMGGWGRR